MKNSYISVGKILNFHGVQGEAKLGYSKNREEFLSKLKQVFVQAGDEYLPLEIVRIRFTPKCGIIKFKGIDTLNDILEYKNKLLFVEETTARKTDENISNGLLNVIRSTLLIMPRRE